MPLKQTAPLNDSERLDRILYHLERIGRRDKMRSAGALFHSILALASALFLLWSGWYFYQHSDEILQKVVGVATEQAQRASEAEFEKLMQQLRGAR